MVMERLSRSWFTRATVGLRIGGLLIGGGLVAACASDDECTTGDETCACFPNDTCNGSLSCLSGLCVADDVSDDEEASDSSGDSNSAEGGAGASGGANASGGSASDDDAESEGSAGASGGSAEDSEREPDDDVAGESDDSANGTSGGSETNEPGVDGGAGVSDTTDDAADSDPTSGGGSRDGGTSGAEEMNASEAGGGTSTPSTGSCQPTDCSPIVPTGQVACYDDSSEMECGALPCEVDGGPAFCGQDAQYASGQKSYTCLDAQGQLQDPCDETADDDEVVQDPQTGLEWQRSQSEGRMEFSEAILYCEETLNEVSYGGKTDWRVPTLEELRSIVDYSVAIPAIDRDAFPGIYGDEIWSVTEAADETLVWYVDFVEGWSGAMPRDSDNYARCVRGVRQTEPEDRFSVEGEQGAQVVTDSHTGLEWQGGEVTSMDWSEALAYCEGLEHAGLSDWRLPDINQLASLVDPGLEPPATQMPDTELVAHWSSTTRAERQISALAVHFEGGGVTSGMKDGTLFKVRCVRQP